MPHVVRTEALTILKRYLEHFPHEHEELQVLHEQLQDDPGVFMRSNMRGHITSSAAVLSPDGREILLVDHKVLGVWLPPGGHYEAPGSLWQSALREVQEETGLQSAVLHPWTQASGIPLQISSKLIPANPQKGEGAHLHHDFRFLALARPQTELHPQLDEVHDARWKPVAVLRDGPGSVLQDLYEKLGFVGAL